jgi:hypothetical protein
MVKSAGRALVAGGVVVTILIQPHLPSSPSVLVPEVSEPGSAAPSAPPQPTDTAPPAPAGSRWLDPLWA